MGIFYKEFALKKVLECGAAKSWKEAKVAEKVYLNAYSGGYPFSISGDIRSLPS